MEIIVTPISEGIAYYKDLHDWAESFDDDPDDPNFDALSYLEGDPDKIKCNGHELYFISTTLNGIRYVLTHDEVNDTEKEMLIHFWQDNFKDYFKELPCSWEAYDNVSKAIAYRGGGGYFYTIWEYTPVKTKLHLTHSMSVPKCKRNSSKDQKSFPGH